MLFILSLARNVTPAHRLSDMRIRILEQIYNKDHFYRNKRKCTIATAVCLHRGCSHFYYLIYFLWVDIGLWIVGGLWVHSG